MSKLYVPTREEENDIVCNMADVITDFFLTKCSKRDLQQACVDRTLHNSLMALMISIADDIVSVAEVDIKEKSA